LQLLSTTQSVNSCRKNSLMGVKHANHRKRAQRDVRKRVFRRQPSSFAVIKGWEGEDHASRFESAMKTRCRRRQGKKE